MEVILASSTAHEAWQTALLAAFALLAILLAAVGLHGVLAYVVEQRRAEFGIRLALGAGPADLRRMILGQGLRHAGAGIVIGSGGALAFTRLASALLFGVSAADPLVFLAVPVLLAVVALGTGYAASRRIGAIDPGTALRYQ